MRAALVTETLRSATAQDVATPVDVLPQLARRWDVERRDDLLDAIKTQHMAGSVFHTLTTRKEMVAGWEKLADAFVIIERAHAEFADLGLLIPHAALATLGPSVALAARPLDVRAFARLVSGGA